MSLKIGVIIGSNRPTRNGEKIAAWFMEQVKDTPEVEFQLIDLAEIDLPFLDEPNVPALGNYQKESTQKWSALIEPLDGFVLVAAEYNHGYTAVLKNALDTLYSEWAKKPVAFVGYGALGAVAAIEQLVNITAQLGMVPQPSTAVKVIQSWGAFDDEGQFDESLVHGKIAGLVANLVWWAQVLQAAREQ